jgi:UDP-N-acetylglucosamine--N-acetylmuramyl-(pentapeptide) pyrophosphoryl-undecaprenol N-acetylglucosamine transferase
MRRADDMSDRTVDFVLVGGGSGGHIVPLLAVAEALKERKSSYTIAHIGHSGDRLNTVTRDSVLIDTVYEISAGKLRRYHGESIFRRLFDVKTLFFNVRDFFRFTKGIFQAWILLGRLQPRAILMKGGYVCANVGIAARIRGIPYMTHDSDAMVSLAHRMIAKHAVYHATAMPPEFYDQFDQSKTVQVGVPIRSVYKVVSEEDKRAAKREIGVSPDARVVLITGGGLGAKNINDAITNSITSILEDSHTYLVHVTGAKLHDVVSSVYELLSVEYRSRIIIESFTDKMHLYSAAADVIVTRASATALSEFAMQSKACIVVPNPLLAGGHQLKNAQALQKLQAAVIVDEDKVDTLLPKEIARLLHDKKARTALGLAMHASVIEGAADKLATMLIEMKKR